MTSLRPAALAALVAAGAAGAAVPAAVAGKAKPKGKTRTVQVGEVFSPEKLTIDVGDRVKWVWKGGWKLHDVYVEKGPEEFHSPTQSSGTYARTFRKRGTFLLYCTQHGMTQTLVVRKKKRPRR